MHGITGGLISQASGGNFGSGFFSGMVSSSIASGVNALGINFAASSGNSTVYNGFGKDYMQAAMIAAGGLSGGISATIAGGNFWDGLRQGIITSALNHMAHLMTQPKPHTTVAGIYGAGGLDASGNPALRQLVEGKGGRMFTSSTGCCDDDFIAYLKEGYKRGD
ncbi:hypothetical protein [Parasediminibacterium sp. JCM 36343]|uniref:hypothetical protein n=1 Tax=Parasediminibacterium sp. JCM 36343 TaxID=3374279 RepID=UPI0039792B6F